MKRLLLIGLLSVSCIFVGYSQTTNAFRVNFDQALFDLPGNAVESITASNYVFAGTNLNFLPIYGTVTEVDDVGNLVWSKRYYDGSIGFQLNDIKKDDASSEYYLCGGSESNAAVFMRIDAAGNVVASTKFEINEADGAYFNRVIKTSDGGYVAVGYVIGHDPDGAGPEIYYAPINYTDTNGDPQTEYIGSPLIVKMDANGNHLWHHVFRYYLNPAMNPATDRIYNDASFTDVVEVADGYIAVGAYDVNQHNSNTNSDGDDATPRDAVVLKTSTAGAITYHKQFDNVNSDPNQSSKYFGAINKTSVGDPIAAGGADDGKEWITKFGAAGGWSLTFSRLFTYSTFFGIPDPVDISQIYEVNGSTDLVTMGMYIKPLSFVFSNSLHRVNSTATNNVWAKYYTFGIGALLPRGSQVSDDGYLMLSMTSGANWDYHLIKTDPNGDTPLAGCAPTSFTPSAAGGPTTIADPYNNNWSGTVGPQGLALTVANVTPTQNIQCSFTTCTPPTINTQPSDITMCSTDSDGLSVVATGGPYQWQYNNGGVWENVTNGSPAGFTYANETTDNMTITTAGAAQGAYQFQVVAGGVGCETISNTITVTVPGATQLAPLGAQCSDVQLNFEAFPASGATYSWLVTPPGGTSATPTSGTGQTFSYVPTNATGSAQNFNVSVDVTYGGTTCTQNFTNTVNPVPTAPVVGTITQPDCITSTGSVDFSGLPASGTWTVTASPGGATATGTGTTGTISGLTDNTSYTFTVTNSFGCTSSASTSATIDPAPTVPTTPVIGSITQTSCSASTGHVQFSGLPTGTWTLTSNPGGFTTTSTGSSGAINNLPPGTYTFTVTNDQGCTSAATGSVTIDPQPPTPPTPIVGVITQPTCSNATGSVDLSGLPGAGSWTLTANPGALTQSGSGTTATFTGLTAGTTYTITVTNGPGCISNPTGNIVIDPQPTTPSAPLIGSITQPTCNTPTGDVALNGLPATGNWTVTVNPGGGTISGTGTTATFSGLNPGNYTFTVTNDEGCTSVASSSATVDPVPGAPSAPVIGTITQPTCNDATGSVDLSGLPGTGNWTVTESPGGTTITGSGTTATFSGLGDNTTYTFTVTNDLGCTSSASINVVIDPQPVTPSAPVIGTITQPTCGTATGSVELTGLPGTGNWTITESPGGTTMNGSGATGTFAGLADNTTYTFTVTNDQGCTSTASLSATIDPQPVSPVEATAGVTVQPTCTTPTGTIEVTAPTGANYTYSVDGTNFQAGTTFSGLAPGNYTITVMDNNSGCSTPSSIMYTVDPIPADPSQPSGSIVTQPTCAAPTGEIEITAPLGANYEYSIDGVTFQSSTTFTGLIPGTYTITVQDISTGCTSLSAGTYTIDPAPGAPTITLDSLTDVSCNGGSDGAIYLTASAATAPYTYVWTPNVGSSDDVTGLAAGSYTVVVTDALGCSATDTYTIGEPSVLLVNGSSTDVDCSGSTGGSIATSVSGGTSAYTYLWSPDNQTSDNIADLAAGSYSVTVTDANGCVATENYTITTSGSLNVTVTPNSTTIEAGESVNLSASGATTYTWTPAEGLSCTDCSDPVATPDVTTTYIVEGSDQYGCFGADTSIIIIEETCGEMYIPNIFSPNGSGPAANEFLCVFGDCIEELTFRVYNRWGELVFETESTFNTSSASMSEVCWDGTHKGQLVQSGTYVYTVNATKSNGDIVEESGNITVVR